MGNWIRYADAKPPSEGVYRWRVPCVALPGEHVIFDAHMRVRGAGYTCVISPAFDHWDGYHVIVPVGTSWQEAPRSSTCKVNDFENLSIEGLSFAACPYCKQIPRLYGTYRTTAGVVVGPKPHELNIWWLECCPWGHTPHMENPREIARIREAAFATLAAKEAANG